MIRNWIWMLLAAAIGMTAAVPAQAQFWQCAPYARTVSGIEIYGNALTWWDQAAGRYDRGSRPVEGAVLSIAPTKRMRLGHVAMVSRVVSAREVLLTHANWSHRGRVEQDVRAIDVSEAGDWSLVRLWYAPMGDLGISAYPANGFIYPDKAAEAEAEAGPDGAMLAAPVLTID